MDPFPRVGWILERAVEDFQDWLNSFAANVGMERSRHGTRAVENDAQVFPDLNMTSI